MSPKSINYSKGISQDIKFGSNLIWTGCKKLSNKGAWFLQRLHQKHIPVKADKYWIKFTVTIGSAKEPSEVEFHTNAPTVAYQQHVHNICWFSTFEFDLFGLRRIGFCKGNINAYH